MKINRIAVDFDGTLCRAMYKKNEHTRSILHKLLLIYLKRKQKQGVVIILNTLRTDPYWLIHAISLLASWGFRPDFVNENDTRSVKVWGKDPRKIDADIYIDDRNFGIVGWLLRHS